MTVSKTSPRNPWDRARKALAFGERRRFDQAHRALDNIKYHPDMSPEALQVFVRRLQRLQDRLDPTPKINTPADYLRHSELGLRAPFPRLRAGSQVPSPFPPTLALPELVGVQNDVSFLQDAATLLAGRVRHRLASAQVILSGMEPEALAALLEDLAAQSYGGRLHITHFAEDAPDITPPPGLTIDVVPAPLLAPQSAERLRAMIEDVPDALMVFLSGRVRLDPAALARAAHYARVTDALVQPLVPQGAEMPLQTTFTDHVRSKLFSSRYPFRDMQGMNFVAPAGALRTCGLPETRFNNTNPAARELAFRMVSKGLYLHPLHVPVVTPPRGAPGAAKDADAALYTSLCPNHWDRKTDGRFEVPRVSIYIPAYNASRYIRRAVDSVLEQDVQDLEVCICDDGSRDDTAEVLERFYGAEPRVKWQTRRNGGIGTGSNAAIHMSRGPYIGQLDSDDALKPGAVRRMMEHLDDNPKVACVYGSCERIDAEGNFLKNEYSWPVFSREKMMITSIAHHFRMFRRSCWERTSKFREDIVNGIDYDIFLKLSETGPMHHIDEIMYQRRWHGENTSVVNESHQTANTHRVQSEALHRLGLDRFWEVHVPDPAEPRRVTYRRKAGTRTVLFWPDYARSNPYQQMLYREARKRAEICAGDIEAALEVQQSLDDPAALTFHLHWLNFLFVDVTDPAEARRIAEGFAAKLARFVENGSRLVWTVHNHVSHDTAFRETEIWLSSQIATLADALHVHADGAAREVSGLFDLPMDKIAVVPHGHYGEAYPDFADRQVARAALGLDPSDDVIVFTGQVRPYKGVETLIAAVRRLLSDRPAARLLIVGEMKFDPLAALSPALTQAEAERITATHRFVGDMEMQLFLRAADLAVYPYEKILTSGSLMLALSFGLPVIIPEVAMTAEVAERLGGGIVRHNPPGDVDALAGLCREMLDRHAGPNGPDVAARLAAADLGWKRIEGLLFGT